MNGLAAEDIAARIYEESGFEVAAQRWKSKAGEIDLIVAKPKLLVFVEVKARASHQKAAYAISSKQWQRIMASAELYVSEQFSAQQIDLRFDAALVDRNGVCKIIENAPIF